jgi:hypothetical protein
MMDSDDPFQKSQGPPQISIDACTITRVLDQIKYTWETIIFSFSKDKGQISVMNAQHTIISTALVSNPNDIDVAFQMNREDFLKIFNTVTRTDTITFSDIIDNDVIMTLSNEILLTKHHIPIKKCIEPSLNTCEIVNETDIKYFKNIIQRLMLNNDITTINIGSGAVNFDGDSGSGIRVSCITMENGSFAKCKISLKLLNDVIGNSVDYGHSITILKGPCLKVCPDSSYTGISHYICGMVDDD